MLVTREVIREQIEAGLDLVRVNGHIARHELYDAAFLASKTSGFDELRDVLSGR